VRTHGNGKARASKQGVSLPIFDVGFRLRWSFLAPKNGARLRLHQDTTSFANNVCEWPICFRVLPKSDLNSPISNNFAEFVIGSYSYVEGWESSRLLWTGDFLVRSAPPTHTAIKHPQSQTKPSTTTSIPSNGASGNKGNDNRPKERNRYNDDNKRSPLKCGECR
jgi:hypothetical protein